MFISFNPYPLTKMKPPNHPNNSPGWTLILYALMVCIVCHAILSGEVLTKTEVMPHAERQWKPYTLEPKPYTLHLSIPPLNYNPAQFPLILI